MTAKKDKAAEINQFLKDSETAKKYKAKAKVVDDKIQYTMLSRSGTVIKVDFMKVVSFLHAKDMRYLVKKYGKTPVAKQAEPHATGPKKQKVEGEKQPTHHVLVFKIEVKAINDIEKYEKTFKAATKADAAKKVEKAIGNQIARYKLVGKDGEKVTGEKWHELDVTLPEERKNPKANKPAKTGTEKPKAKREKPASKLEQPSTGKPAEKKVSFMEYVKIVEREKDIAGISDEPIREMSENDKEMMGLNTRRTRSAWDKHLASVATEATEVMKALKANASVSVGVQSQDSKYKYTYDPEKVGTPHDNYIDYRQQIRRGAFTKGDEGVLDIDGYLVQTKFGGNKKHGHRPAKPSTGEKKPKASVKKPKGEKKPGEYYYGTHRPIGLAGIPVHMIIEAIVASNPAITTADVKTKTFEIEPRPETNDVWTRYRISTNYPIPAVKLKEFEFVEVNAKAAKKKAEPKPPVAGTTKPEISAALDKKRDDTIKELQSLLAVITPAAKEGITGMDNIVNRVTNRIASLKAATDPQGLKVTIEWANEDDIKGAIKHAEDSADYHMEQAKFREGKLGEYSSTTRGEVHADARVSDYLKEWARQAKRGDYTKYPSLANTIGLIDKEIRAMAPEKPGVHFYTTKNPIASMEKNLGTHDITKERLIHSIHVGGFHIAVADVKLEVVGSMIKTNYPIPDGALRWHGIEKSTKQAWDAVAKKAEPTPAEKAQELTRVRVQPEIDMRAAVTDIVNGVAAAAGLKTKQREGIDKTPVIIIDIFGDKKQYVYVSFKKSNLGFYLSDIVVDSIPQKLDIVKEKLETTLANHVQYLIGQQSIIHQAEVEIEKAAKKKAEAEKKEIVLVKGTLENGPTGAFEL